MLAAARTDFVGNIYFSFPARGNLLAGGKGCGAASRAFYFFDDERRITRIPERKGMFQSGVLRLFSEVVACFFKSDGWCASFAV